MENKKIIIAIIVVVILIASLIGISYLYNEFNTKQMNILTQESNKLLEMDIATGEISTEIKTEKTYAIVEKAMKEYLVELKNTYLEVETLKKEMNPNDIFSVQNIEDKNLEEIDKIIQDYKDKCEKLKNEYKALIQEEKIKENITTQEINTRKDYYINLYNTVMLSDAMKKQYTTLGEKIEKETDTIATKLKQIEKIKKFLEDNEKYWKIKEDKIQFTNINIMTQYYGLLNELLD